MQYCYSWDWRIQVVFLKATLIQLHLWKKIILIWIKLYFNIFKLHQRYIQENFCFYFERICPSRFYNWSFLSVSIAEFIFTNLFQENYFRTCLKIGWLCIAEMIPYRSPQWKRYLISYFFSYFWSVGNCSKYPWWHGKMAEKDLDLIF